MPVTRTLKTYGRVKKNVPKVDSLNCSRIPVSEASIVFDALLAENIRKRDLPHKYEREKRKTRKNQIKIPELPQEKDPNVFNDSLEVDINSTFDKLLLGVQYNSVKLTDNIVKMISDDSSSISVSEPHKSNIITRSKSKTERERSGKTASRKHLSRNVSHGKICRTKLTKNKSNKSFVKSTRKTKSSKNKPNIIVISNKDEYLHYDCKAIAKQTSINQVNDRSNEKKSHKTIIHNLVDFSLVKENVNMHSYNKESIIKLSKLFQEENDKARSKKKSLNNKLSTSKTPMSRLRTSNNSKSENDINLIFGDSFKHCMHAESTPKYIKSSSTPNESKCVKKLYDSKLDFLTPITSEPNKFSKGYNTSLFMTCKERRIHRLRSASKKCYESMENCSKINISLKNSHDKIITTGKDSDSESESEDDDVDLKLCLRPVIVQDDILDMLGISCHRNISKKSNNNTKKSYFTRSKSSSFIIDDTPDILPVPIIRKNKTTVKLKHPEEKTELKEPEQKNNSYMNIKELTPTYTDASSKSENSQQTCDPRMKNVSKNIITYLREWESFSEIFTQNVEETKITPEKKVNIKNNIQVPAVESPKLAQLLSKNQETSVFLRPGKQWQRCLSILRQHRTEEHTVSISQSVPKGRKWRQSVTELIGKQNPLVPDVLSKCPDQSSTASYKNNAELSPRHRGRLSSYKIVKLSEIHRTRPSKKSFRGYDSAITDDTILEDFAELSLVENTTDQENPAEELILRHCKQTAPLFFDKCYSERTLKKCRKIGEGVYGEVFMYKTAENKCVVMKIIPIEGKQLVNGEQQKKFGEIISEIIISTELSNLRDNTHFRTDGFTEVLNVSLVQGKYPKHLLELWELYDEDRGSENDSPELFTDDQLYIVLELTNGGQDLEAYQFTNAVQSYSLFIQIACTLAVAEAALQFEHRDLHWGNVLISRTDDPTVTFLLNGREFEVPTKGLKLTIIDFTLSRMTLDNCCIFNDLAMDPDLFTAKGDYQFDIYRLMQKQNQDDWQRFEPHTNILWLDYTLDKIISQVHYVHTNSKIHKNHIRKLSQLRKKILTYNSVLEFVNSGVFETVFL